MKPAGVDNAGWLVTLDILFTREKVGVPIGIFPLAFSDMPRSCVGTELSIEESTDGVRECRFEAEDMDGCSTKLWSSSTSESSSSPIAKAPPSSGTLLRVGVMALVGLLRTSAESPRTLRAGLRASSEDSSAASFCRCFSFSISSCPLSRVKLRRASNLLRDFNIAKMNFEFSVLIRSIL